MNRGCKVLIFKVIFSQHILNKSLTKREINERRSLMSQRTFWLVEILLRVYIAYYQYIYYHIQQFNNSTKIKRCYKDLLVSLGQKQFADDKRLYRFLFSPASHLQGIVP